MSVLLWCASRKPAPGVEKPSAARELLRVVEEGVREVGVQVTWMDMRKLDLPFFDGRRLEEYDSPHLLQLKEEIERANTIILSAPAYWGGPAGPLKNCLDLLGGAAYDKQQERNSCLSGKSVWLLVVGADDLSAQMGFVSLQVSLQAMGAWVSPNHIVIGNPRQIANPKELIRRLRAFGRSAATAIKEVGYAPTKVRSGSTG